VICSISDRSPQIADTDSANYAEPNEEVAIRMTGSGEPYTETTHYDSGHNHNRLDVTLGQGSKKQAIIRG
jgi:hypothetical protein